MQCKNRKKGTAVGRPARNRNQQSVAYHEQPLHLRYTTIAPFPTHRRLKAVPGTAGVTCEYVSLFFPRKSVTDIVMSTPYRIPIKPGQSVLWRQYDASAPFLALVKVGTRNSHCVPKVTDAHFINPRKSFYDQWRSAALVDVGCKARAPCVLPTFLDADYKASHKRVTWIMLLWIIRHCLK